MPYVNIKNELDRIQRARQVIREIAEWPAPSVERMTDDLAEMLAAARYEPGRIADLQGALQSEYANVKDSIDALSRELGGIEHNLEKARRIIHGGRS